jgi:hypothetical protein
LNYQHVLFIFVVCTHVACVSVNLDSGKTSKASGVRFSEPNSPFKKIDNPTVDHGWQNPQSGNTIAYLSECNAKADVTLAAMEGENISALTNAKIVKTENRNYNGRESKESTVEGLVDGIPVKMALLVFKKNGCNYTLSYVGRKKYFEADLPRYKTFKEKFNAP